MLISKKIWILVATAMTTCAVVSGYGLYGMNFVNANVVEISEKSVPSVILASQIRINYLSVIPQVYKRAITTDAAKGEALGNTIDSTNATLMRQTSEYMAHITDEEEKAVLFEAQLSLLSFVTKLRQVNQSTR